MTCREKEHLPTIQADSMLIESPQLESVMSSVAGFTSSITNSNHATSSAFLDMTSQISPQHMRIKTTCPDHVDTSLHSWYQRNYPLPPKKIVCSMEKEASLFKQINNGKMDDGSCLQNDTDPFTFTGEYETHVQPFLAMQKAPSVTDYQNGSKEIDLDTQTYTVLENSTDLHVQKHGSNHTHLQRQQQFTHTHDSFMDQKTFKKNCKDDCPDRCNGSGLGSRTKLINVVPDRWKLPSPESSNEVLMNNRNNEKIGSDSGYGTHIPSDSDSPPISDGSPMQNPYNCEWNMVPACKKKKPSSLSSGSCLSSASSPPLIEVVASVETANKNAVPSPSVSRTSPSVSRTSTSVSRTSTSVSRTSTSVFVDSPNWSNFRHKYFPVSHEKICFESTQLSKVLPQLKKSTSAETSESRPYSSVDQNKKPDHRIEDSASSVKQLPVTKEDTPSSVSLDGQPDEKCDSVNIPSDDVGKATFSKVKVKQEWTLPPSLQSNGLCQVCGDVAAGFYCGAFICEACKKFFVRVCKQDKVKYVCHRDQKCEITKENRIRCQYCRYKKCLSVNMICPSDNAVGSKPDIYNIPCRVCGGPSSGFHFGALTCEGCKGFFRRMAKERQPNMYQCPKKDNCSINTFTRNICKACRYRKCIEVGMSVEGSRIGRQSNSVKHAISLEAKHLMPSDTRVSLACNVEVKPESDDSSKTMSTNPREDVHVPLIEIKQEPIFFPDNMEDLLADLGLAMNHFSDLTMKAFSSDISKLSTMEGAWDQMMNHMEVSAKCTIMFAKKVPGFKSLMMADQVPLMQLATYPISVINFARQFDIDKGDNACLGFTRTEEKMLLKFFPMFEILPTHHSHVGFMLKYLDIDDTEMAIMFALILFSNECEILKENWKVKKWHEYYVDCLQQYEQMAYKDGETRFGVLLIRLSELASLSLQQNKTMMSIIASHPQLQVHVLFKEIYAA